MKKFIILAGFLTLLLASCKNKDHTGHSGSSEIEEYTCPMHPQIIRNEPGNCPICGMPLVKKEEGNLNKDSIDLETLLKPTNEFVVSSVPVVTLKKGAENIQLNTFGSVAYDTRYTGSISSRVAGRIEKLYVRFRYQRVNKGQRILDIYSPELLTAQQNLLFLLKHDAGNESLVSAAKQKLQLLGMGQQQIKRVIQNGRPDFSIPVYSNYAGHIHEAGNSLSMGTQPQNVNSSMKDISLITAELPLKEGMYLQKGQTIFNVFNPGRTWVLLNVFAADIAQVKKGQAVTIFPETNAAQKFRGTIDFIEPFFKEGSKTVTARVYFNNSAMNIPVGSQVKASIWLNDVSGNWLPKQSVLSLGFDKVVFVKSQNGFLPKIVATGIETGNLLQITNGLTLADSVAANAQYLMDSESFIKIKKQDL